MIKALRIFSVGFFLVFVVIHCTADTLKGHVVKEEIFGGYIVRKVWLHDAVAPTVIVKSRSYTNDAHLPDGVSMRVSDKITVMLGVEKKRPFALLKIPVFAPGSSSNGTVRQLTDFELEIQEHESSAKPASKSTDVSSSVLSSGTWYKVGITNSGYYKIDYNFISSLGVDPTKVDPSKIRVFGNGGAMLSEANAVTRPSDLLENAIYVSSTGSTFAQGDYIMFYASGTTAWVADSVNKVFNHQVNLYADTAFYFVSFDLEGTGLRVAAAPALPTPNVDVNYYDYHDYHEVDLVNPAGFGKNWYGEEFNQLAGNLSQAFTFSPGSVLDSVKCTVSFANVQDVPGSSFYFLVNGVRAGSYVFGTPTTGDNIMNLGALTTKNQINSNAINVQVTFTPVSTASDGWLNYIELNGRRQLSVAGDQFSFRDLRSIAPGNTAKYHVQGAGSTTNVWDITNPQVPVVMNGTLSGTEYSFAQDAGILHEFALFNTVNVAAPYYIGQVANQNLHGSPQVNCIIVANPEFYDQAEQLAAYHRSHDNLSVIAVTTTQVYNEFSSGQQDISAIRDFARMFYKRANNDTTKMPAYLLLFGGASYDYKNRLPNNSNYVPVFETAESFNDLSAFSTDDFYGFLDDNENIEDGGINALDIAVGRLPARSTDDATNMVNKILNYTSVNSLGPWRISATICADNDDQAGDHMEDGEYMAATITGCSRDLYNQRKVYIDALPVISTPAGTRCPDANAAIDDQVYKGTFIMNYNGHGNPSVWAGERILTQDDFNNWQNGNALPFMVTATCDFGQFDHPQYKSAAEELVERNNAGVIAILTTTQAVYAVYNRIINSQYLQYQFTRNTDGSWNTFGTAAMIAKNNTYIVPNADQGEITNFRKFALLGDPALTPDFPKYNTVIDSVLDGNSLLPSDTVKALGAYIMKGSVRDNNGNVISDFNGDLTVTIYDKPRNIETISGTNVIFQMQDNTIYKGKVSVTNGKFSFTFITPKDIYYFFGKGKISTYATNGVTDAAGTDTSFVVGGFSDNPVVSTTPPEVRPYINDSLFHDGGITGSNTSLFVILNDQTGINVSGNDVGHDLTAVLDDNHEQPYLLNDFYETAPNTYQVGYINFPVSGLADGPHHLKVTAWDVNDNTGSGVVNFTVIDGSVTDIQNLGNYPNPFSDLTHFVFEHNHPMEQLKVEIQLYNTEGAKVKTINETFTPQGSWSNDITWDGTGDNGAKLPSGVYVYKLSVTSDRGFVSSAYQKLVIVR